MLGLSVPAFQPAVYAGAGAGGPQPSGRDGSMYGTKREAQCPCMGRSKTAVLTQRMGRLFGDDHQFHYGEGHWLRQGKDAVIITLA